MFGLSTQKRCKCIIEGGVSPVIFDLITQFCLNPIQEDPPFKTPIQNHFRVVPTTIHNSPSGLVFQKGNIVNLKCAVSLSLFMVILLYKHDSILVVLKCMLPWPLCSIRQSFIFNITILSDYY